MLEILRRIVQDVNSSRSLDQALEVIVKRVKQAMDVDVCSVYLLEKSLNQYVLMATEGLNSGSVGLVRLDPGTGLIGMVGERAEPINLENATEHPSYKYFPETGEEQYSGFLGVPIIQHRKVLGVLTTQTFAKKSFPEDSVSFLVTVAAQLSGAITHAEASGDINGFMAKKVRKALPLDGVRGAPGVAMGTAVVVYPMADLAAVPDRTISKFKADLALLDKAVAVVRVEIQNILERLEKLDLPAEDKALFDAYLLMLDSGGMIDKVREHINAGNWAPGALREVVEEHVRIFQEMEDPYLSERASDVRDLGIRILSHMQESETNTAIDYPRKTVLVGEEITASLLAEVPPKKLVGVVSVRGSLNSHVAILARALGVPAVMGVSDLPVSRVDGHELIIDGYQGKVHVAPPASVRKEYKRLIKEEREMSAELQELSTLPAETLDGVRIPLYVNSGLLSDIQPSRKSGAEGVGLYRTEFPFMVRDRFPGEEEQCRIYREVLKAYEGKPVVVRTLDVGGDKALHYFPIVEDNPFLGWRGIRLTLDHPEIFLVQLRAILRASVDLDNLYLLLPMVSNVSEVDESLRLFDQAHKELLEEGLNISKPPIGVMIEVPSAVYLAEALARRVDFLSIGTNDLTQYLLAVDRNNARVAHLYDSLHPAIMMALLQVVQGARKYEKHVSVCGEMAGDPAAVILLLGLGVDSLSMNASSIPRVKSVIRKFSRAQAQELLEQALAMEDFSSIRELLNDALEKAGLGGLVRAGK
jgi:phosphotransferase system enzyme I (PtsP)